MHIAVIYNFRELLEFFNNELLAFNDLVNKNKSHRNSLGLIPLQVAVSFNRMDLAPFLIPEGFNLE